MSVSIHPTALVESGAQLGEGVQVGPFCYIQNGVEIGDRCELISHAVIMSGTRLGEAAKIFPHAVLGAEPQNNKHQGAPTSLIIGKNCVIREGVTMHRGSDSSIGKTVVGDNCMFLAYAHVAHDCLLGDHVTFSNNVMIGGHVIIGDHVIIGGGGAVHQFVRVGHHAFVGGLAALVGDLIPYGTAVGVNAKLAGLNIIGMKRSGMKREEIHNVRHAFALLFDRTKPVHERAADVSQLFPQSRSVCEIIRFINDNTKRSFCTPFLKGTSPHSCADNG